MSKNDQSRRDFLKSLAVLGAWPIAAAGGRGFGLGRSQASPAAETTGFIYKARTLSVSHFPELQAWMDGLRRDDKLSRHPVYRSYIDNRSFAVPDDFPAAASVVILAYATPMLRLNVRHRGRDREIVLSPLYFEDGVTRAGLEAVVRRDIVRDPAAKLVPAQRLHLKLLAVRSGLGRYGRNNICFVDGMGTYHALFAFLTDATGLPDSWGELALLEDCRECPLCYSLCPTGAIRRESFVIDAGRCVTLYNEVEGEFPNWILPSMHNALMGCLKCQLGCPANEKPGPRIERGGDIDEDETAKILAGAPDDALLASLGRKLRGFPPATDRAQFPILTRNLAALLRG
jgi:epoxyqueuosine reductase